MTKNEKSEMRVNKEKSPARKELELLESSDQFLFHGSPSEIEEFEPKQAYNGDPNNKETWPDGPPGIAGGEMADVAIFRAIFNRSNIDPSITLATSWDDETGSNFKVNQAGFNKALQDQPSGFVYVFKREDFHPFRGKEWRRESSIRSYKKIVVGVQDLPDDIKII